jgi:hypothetical protein
MEKKEMEPASSSDSNGNGKGIALIKDGLNHMYYPRWIFEINSCVDKQYYDFS